MAEEFQAEPPRPRRDWGDDVGNRPVQPQQGGMPVWAWVLIGVGALTVCLVPGVLALGMFFFWARSDSAPAVAPMPPATEEPAPVTVPEKEKAP